MKIYWKIVNFIESKYIEYKQAEGTYSGLLRHKEDKRDFIAGMVWLKAKPEKQSILHHLGDIFDQSPFNICVFASLVQLLSDQNGIKLSVRWPVIVARRKGWLNGNGWSYLRAGLKIANNIGMVPVEHLPDETRWSSWDAYSTIDDKTYNRLLVIADNYKIPEYRRIRNWNAATEAIKRGLLLYTGITWTTGNNSPKKTNNILSFLGQVVGGHAIYLSGFKQFGELFQNPETFGRNFGEKGVVWIDRLFGKYNSAIYVMEDMDFNTRLEEFKKQNEEKIVRTLSNPACYLIKDGKKKYIKNTTLLSELEKKYDTALKYVQTELLEKIEKSN